MAAERGWRGEPAQGLQPVELRELETMDELRPLEHLQRIVWGTDELEIVPATAMRAAVHAGGLVVGALVAGQAIGFAFGFVSTPHGRGMSGVGMHSHMAAVLPEFRRSGVGRRLKRYQADWCVTRGLGWISWTFDPLRAENARFNLALLGARCHDYLTDFYGPMPGTLGGGLESDRLLAVWRLELGGDEQVPATTDRERLGDHSAGGDRGVRPDRMTDHGGASWLLPPGHRPLPMDAAATEQALVEASTLLVATPDPRDDVFSDAGLAMGWRAAHRRTLREALERGWVATGFRDGAYVLERSSSRAKT